MLQSEMSPLDVAVSSQNPPVFHTSHWYSGMTASLTFEEDELALAVLVRGVDLCRQASPEHVDEHGVSRHDRVVPHSPKPVVLKEAQWTIEPAGKTQEKP